MEHPGTPSATPHAAAPDYSPTDPASTGRLRHWLGGTRLSRWYAGRSRRGQLVVELLLASALPPLLGFVVYYLVALTPARGALGVLFWVYFLALAATAVLIVMECARAFRFPEPPVRTPVPREQLPRVAAVIAAYLPNEQDTILDSIAAHLAVDYPADRHVVVVAYNAPEPLPIEAELVDLAAREPRLMTMRVQGSTSKVENVTAALHQIGSEVEVIGIFDADHHPHPKAPRRVAQWLSDAAGDKRFDMVQGQCAIRNDDEGFVARTVTAEFATLYGVAHPGRTVVNDFGIFGGSNGWWRAPVLLELGLDEAMLTEDIDVSARALAQGYRLGTDPRVISWELAPTTWSAWWRQRMRWAQGWHEVSVRHFWPLMRNSRLSGIQRRGVLFLFGWRLVHPFVATQLLPLVVAMAVAGRQRVVWDLLFFLVAAVCVNGVSLVQALAANRLAVPGVASRPGLYARFVLLSLLFYSELRLSVTRGAVVRHLLGARSWDVTTRTRSAGTPVVDAPAEERALEVVRAAS